MSGVTGKGSHAPKRLESFQYEEGTRSSWSHLSHRSVGESDLSSLFFTACNPHYWHWEPSGGRDAVSPLPVSHSRDSRLRSEQEALPWCSSPPGDKRIETAHAFPRLGSPSSQEGMRSRRDGMNASTWPKSSNTFRISVMYFKLKFKCIFSCDKDITTFKINPQYKISGALDVSILTLW